MYLLPLLLKRSCGISNQYCLLIVESLAAQLACGYLTMLGLISESVALSDAVEIFCYFEGTNKCIEIFMIEIFLHFVS